MKQIKKVCPNWKKCKLRKQANERVIELKEELESCDSMPRYSELEALIKELEYIFNL
jgi:hypothetical protein